jgi:hypothetical protein
MGRLRFFGQEEFDIRLRTDRGRSPRRLVPRSARALPPGGYAMGNAPTVPRQSLHQTLAAEVYGSPKLVAAERGDGLVLEQSDERSVGEQSEVPVSPRVSSHKRRHQGATAPGQPREPHVFLDRVLVINWRDAARPSYVGEASNWARYSWVIAKAASRGSATSNHTLLQGRRSSSTIAIGALLSAGHRARSRPPKSIRG